MDDEVLEQYTRFVAERHRVWEGRQQGLPAPWTDDRILRSKKFTNVFRVLDHGTQYLLRLIRRNDELPWPEPEDVLLRAWLYRFTNRPEPWEHFYREHGRYPVWADLESGAIRASWLRLRGEGGRIFGGAYMIVGGLSGNIIANVLDIAEEWLPRVAPPILSGTTPEETYGLLVGMPACSRFLGMQITTDLGYSNAFADDENTFIVPGPGALRGGKELIGTAGSLRVTKLIWQLQTWLPELLGDETPALQVGTTTRHPSLMDVQNTLCEFSKYRRHLRKLPVDLKPYLPAHPGPVANLVLPDHWDTERDRKELL